ncbi:hypothetical protein GDO81_028561 [Engystomops pustulosus]|uniref:Taste receptor type 2 n=1 Tax=Engystomops pustulosus TaxID=76066 RepID=A0AAV6ZL53_ENGPU|nr:hypothetical protein GDO81_028561 [Engystomops pustulosus]
MLAINSCFLFITFPGHIFILAMNILEWKKNKRLDISDQLISGLGLLSFLYKVFQVGFKCVEVIHGVQAFTGSAWLSVYLIYNSLNFCTLLFSTWLTIHFCLKIVNINQNFYIYIQRMFPKMFPWILLPSVLVSLLISLPAAQDLSKHYSNSTFLLNLGSSQLKRFHYLKLYYSITSFCFVFSLIPLLITIVSLCRHIHRMQSHSLRLRADSVSAHVYAVKTLILLLCLNCLQFVIPVLVTQRRYNSTFIPVIFLFLVMWHLCNLPILIRGSSKLQKKLHEIWICCSFLVS